MDYARKLTTLLPLPFRRGEGRGEGSLVSSIPWSPLNLTIPFLALLLGCTTDGSKVGSEIEGTYVRDDKPNISLIIGHGHFLQGARDLHAEGAYTARKLAEHKYELNIVYSGHLEGAKDRVLVRKEGDFVFVQDDGEGPETRFRKQ